MTARRCVIPTCQRILAWEQVNDPKPQAMPRSRYCGNPSIAVNVYPDGREQFVCAQHDEPQAEPGPVWGTHRRGPSALTV